MNTVKQRTLILASSSPRRQELIRSLDFPVKIFASHVDETVTETLTPAQIVETLSLRKADAAAEQLKQTGDDGIVIGSDTIVVMEGKVLGKPSDRREAFHMLQSLQGKTHRVFTGVACIDLGTGKRLVRHRVTNVTMKPLTDRQIERYIETGEPLDKAGAYAIQGLGATIVDSIEGCYFNVVGLPLALLGDMLAEFGVEVL